MRYLPCLLLIYAVTNSATVLAETRIKVTVDRGPDRGQCFGSLFEVTSQDGKYVLGAGFQNAYNTRYRADRHAIQFFVRPTDAKRPFDAQALGRPNDNLTGSYLFARDEQVYSTYGQAKVWDDESQSWKPTADSGGTNETMRLGEKSLSFGNSSVVFDGDQLLEPPESGSYELFFYANGYLCFYHVDRRGGPYRPFRDDRDGFSKLYACPWVPGQPKIDLANAHVMQLPVVGETTFAWGQLGQQIVTGSNIGGFYVFENGKWRMLLAPDTKVSYQLYSSLGYGDKLLMGQYPTGRLFEYDGKQIRDVHGWPPVLAGVSANAREAQTSVIYGGDLMVGVWPWGELWRYSPDKNEWFFVQRMFEHPELSADVTHPYDQENRGNSPTNFWGQRVTSLVPIGADLFISTSAKAPRVWDPKPFPFLVNDQWKSYGTVYRATMPGHVGGTAKWTEGATTFEFLFDDRQLSILQDRITIASEPVTGSYAKELGSIALHPNIEWGTGIYGQFSGPSITGSITLD